MQRLERDQTFGAIRIVADQSLQSNKYETNKQQLLHLEEYWPRFVRAKEKPQPRAIGTMAGHKKSRNPNTGCGFSQ